MTEKKLEGIEAAKKLAVQIQPLAAALEDMLMGMAGERVSFVLLLSVGQVMQYAANVEREDGMKILRELLERWEANRADIPAHMNPDLHPGVLEKNYRFPDGRMDWGAVDFELHAIFPELVGADLWPERLSKLRTLLRKVSGQ